MSKDIAQTFGFKRSAWLIAIVAALVVIATLGTQWRQSEAALPTTSVVMSGSVSSLPGGSTSYTATFTFTPDGTVPAGGSGTFVWSADPDLIFVSVTGTGLTAIDTTDCSVVSGVISCVDDGGENWTSGTLTFNFTNPLGGAAISAAGACILTDVTAVNCTGSVAGTTVENAVQVTPEGVLVAAGIEEATNVLGVPETFTFHFPADFTCLSDLDDDLITPECVAGDVLLDGDIELVSIAPGPVDEYGSDTIEVTIVNSTANSTGGEVCLNVALGDENNVIPIIIDDQTRAIESVFRGEEFVSECGTKVYAGAELRHISDDAMVVAGRQEINFNVRGSRHTICTVAEGTDDPIQIPGITLANIVVTNGGGYASTIDTDPDFTDVRIFIGTGDSNDATEGLLGATCISWVSTDAGDQQINLVYVGEDGFNHNVSWDNTPNGNIANGSLIKEWNRLDDSQLYINNAPQGAAQHVAKTYGVVFNPGTGLYQFSGVPHDAVAIEDLFEGSHTNSAGGLESTPLAGVIWEISYEGCEAKIAYPNGTSGVTTLVSAGAVGNNPNVIVTPGNCLPGEYVIIQFYGHEPDQLGSGDGIDVYETVTITFTQNIAEKQVFLAWAGQRIILEHDWRLAPGDGGPDGSDYEYFGPSANGVCPFQGNGAFQLQANVESAAPPPSYFIVQHIKGTGPGNFVAGLGVEIGGADSAYAAVGIDDVSQTLESADFGDDDINDFPQDNCISRVLYESEDPGEVDIEAFAYDQTRPLLLPTENYSKVAFVIYYMKINTINVSLVTQVSKPTHNASWTDFAPGNPWDASKDDADNAVDWNVSKDLLVRGRVTGWFTNSNPSGRAADTSNPLNVLPENRWVMPNDWPLLAGGPADPADGTDSIGTAEQFRPYYDIMFAPNNARGLALTMPDGLYWDQLTVVATGSTGKGSTAGPIKVLSCSDLPAGRSIKVGSVATTVTGCAAGSLVVNGGSGLASAPAVGTPVLFVSYVPFEGPYSLLDIIGFAAEGKGGAALSNLDDSWYGDDLIGSIRDAGKADGDVDMWDAPMPPAVVSVALRGTGFLKAVYKEDAYYNGTPNTAQLGVGGTQTYPNAFYISNIPDSPFIPAVVAGGGYHWNSWGNDGPGGDGMGPYWFWEPVFVGTNSEGIGEITSTTSADGLELGLLRNYHDDPSIARDLVVYTDNHGEFMVIANGDFKTDLTACATNVLAGGKHCKPGDKVGTGTITATVDYPDFRGKHFPVLSNAATVTWTWGGYKDVTVEPGETDQYKYIVFHAMDRDGFCSSLGSTAVLLHSVLSRSALGIDDEDTAFTAANLATSMRYNNDPTENVDFLIDSGEGIIIGVSDAGAIINDGKQFATDVWTYSTYENDPAATGIKEFPLSSLAAAGAVDECQAWIKVSNSLLGVLNVLAIAADDEGNIGFDKIIDLTNTTSYTLNFRWSLVTWAGADAIAVNDAIKGTGTSGKNPGGNDISASVTAIYGWDAAAQQWLGFFPSGVNVPGANDLTALSTGQAYWIAITGPSSVTWTIASNVN